MAISRLDGIRVMEAGSYDTVPNPLDVLRPGNYSIRITIPARTLAPGDYNVNFNFVSLPKREGLNVTNPIMRLSFRLDDVTTMRGNQRTGFFSTKLPWDVTPL
jgi:lipopolysaccharide transport system ATP-binding protein